MRIAVYCGSSAGNDEAFAIAAYTLGQWMGEHGHELIYGGSNTGIMGAVADGVLESGGAVTGVVPNVPVILGRVHPGLTTLIKTETMAERKTRMIELADAFIALPGGLGTLDELTEILSLESLDIISGPIVLYSVNGYWEPMKAVFANVLQNGFGKPEYFSQVRFADSPEALSGILRG